MSDILTSSELHVLVNNSGSNWAAPYNEYPSSAWTRVLTLNLHRVFDLTKLVTPLLEKGASENDPARVINIGSVDGLRVPSHETFAYSASKAGLHHLSRVLANHLGRRNITCVVSIPGSMTTANVNRVLDLTPLLADPSRAR